MQLFKGMQEHGVEPDVVTCCSLISALENGGQWRLALHLFIQMCTEPTENGNPGPLHDTAMELQKV
jgi:pentatricopeptide repeat protein